jgi:hypothetical protein
MSRRTVLTTLSVVAVVVIASVVLLFVVAPAGAGSASGATLDHVAERSDRDSAEVLASRDWGEGELVLVGYDRDGVRRLGLAFASEALRGWRVDSYTEEPVEPDDVVVGSLLVASSSGGGGQPAWSAAVGELLDKRVDRVEIVWRDEEESVGPRTGDAYLVVRRGQTRARKARFLSDEGAEIATVPISKV